MFERGRENVLSPEPSIVVDESSRTYLTGVPVPVVSHSNRVPVVLVQNISDPVKVFLQLLRHKVNHPIVVNAVNLASVSPVQVKV